jgi:hypothetical protein
VRRLALLFGVLVLGLVVACGGGDDDDSNGDGGTPTATESSSSSSSGGGGSDDRGGSSGGGADSDFCSPDDADAIFGSLDFANVTDMESQFSDLGDALDEWADRAPGEIEDDVELMVDTIRGLIELLEEYDYDFLAIGLSASDDPRFLALESDEFTAASERVSEFCGYDFDAPSSGSSSSDGGGSSGGGGFAGAVELPEDFPEGLIPPDAELEFVADLGFGLTVQYTSTATVSEITDYYTDAMGDPLFAAADSASWFATEGGTATTVTVSIVDGDLQVVIVIQSE